MQKLRTLSGAAFDREFLRMMIEDHQHATQSLSAYRQMVDDPELLALFAKATPILNQHLKIAYILNAKITATPTPAS
jgi:predicted outer membrane protein